MNATNRVDYVLGLDLGQAADLSALCLLERTKSNDEPARYAGRALRRWPPGTPYPSIVNEVAKAADNPELRRATLVLGVTEVGRPVLDLFRRARMPVQLAAVAVTAGLDESNGDDVHSVAKVVLVSGVQVLLQQRRLAFARNLVDIPLLLRELQNYRIKPPAPNDMYAMRDGQNDDLVLALAIACWWGERGLRMPWFM